jgi:hypothetical protein|tara:strand:- start:734 stop:910 length:177 start_codon:yes stop_codon:yes gene_type:complete
MGKIKRAKVLLTQTTSHGTLYKDSVVRVEDVNESIARVRDDVGKIYYLDIKYITYIKF